MSGVSLLPQVVQLNEVGHFEAFSDANATRYLSVVGLVILFYDHLLTLNDEVRLVWRAPGSLPKYGFLLNRYLVLGCLIAVSCQMCGFVGTVYSDTGQVTTEAISSMLAVLSIGIANSLVLLRVVILWDHRPIIFKLMAGGFILTFSVQVTLMIIALVKLLPGIQWSPVVNMCIATSTTPLYIAVWTAPLFFELLVLFTIFLNALDRPRTVQLPFTKALWRDGVTYFMALTFLRALNMAFSTTANPNLTMLGVFFVWAMTTMILNRSLLRLRQAEVEEQIPPTSGRASPFGLVITRSRGSIIGMGTVVHVELESPSTAARKFRYSTSIA